MQLVAQHVGSCSRADAAAAANCDSGGYVPIQLLQIEVRLVVEMHACLGTTRQQEFDQYAVVDLQSAGCSTIAGRSAPARFAGSVGCRIGPPDDSE